MFDTAVSETSLEFFENLLEDMAACSEEYEKLCAVLEEKCGNDESGYSLAPPSSNIRNALQDSRDDVASVCRHLVGSDGADQPEGGEMVEVESPQAGGSLSQVRNREEAFRALLRAADFFKRTEPHSPVSYALEQAVRWGRMQLPDLLTELIPDGTTRDELFKRVGIKLPEETEQG
jgi:type VI secretion system protein ImpA